MGTITPMMHAARPVALARGLLAHADAAPAVARPADVMRAAERYAPRLGSLAGDDAERGLRLVRAALEGLDPVIVVNRRGDSVAALAEGTDELLATIHTTPARGVGGHLHRAVRWAWERHLGTHGEGARAGRTVFGSVQLVPRGSSLAVHGPARGGFGVRAYGDQAVELQRAAQARATFTASDSGLALRPDRPAPIERLDEVVLERLAASNGFRRDALAAASDYRIGVRSSGTAAERRATFRELLHEPDAARAARELREHLSSRVSTDLDHVVEAQVRGVGLDDVVAVHAEPRGAAADPRRIQHG